MKRKKRKPPSKEEEMDEAMIALNFYREIVQALRTTGVRKILVSISDDGRLDADIVQTAKSPCGHKGSGTKN